MSVLANYDKYDYDYISYWESRQYEHEAEVFALKALLKGIKGKRFIDIGGSYGRLLPVYKDHYDEIIIMDYSLKTLERYSDNIKEISPKVRLVAANAYYMPFVESSFDGALMVRVLHHIVKQAQFFKEQERILSEGGHFILDVPNKLNLKAKIRSLLTGDMSIYKDEPLQQPSHGANEGSKGEYVPFLNFDPSSISNQLGKANLAVVEKRSCSYMRSTPFARHLPTQVSMSFEMLLNSILNRYEITPSIFMLSRDQNKEKRNHLSESFESVLRCPKCKGLLEKRDGYYCKKDNLTYPIYKDVLDMRYDE